VVTHCGLSYIKQSLTQKINSKKITHMAMTKRQSMTTQRIYSFIIILIKKLIKNIFIVKNIDLTILHVYKLYSQYSIII